MKSFLAALLPLFIVVACTDVTGGGSSGTVGDGGSEGGFAVDPQRAAICDQYASAAASCCAQMPGTCPSQDAAYWKNNRCLPAASTCAAMPTCFSSGDCNTFINCSAAAC